MLHDSSILLRQMTSLDLPAAWQLSHTLHWPHRLDDWAMAYRLSDGYVMEDSGKVVGSALICNQGDYATIGLVIVANSHQGKGLGRRLMQHCLDAAKSPNILLNATAEGLTLYQRLGFESYGLTYQFQVAGLTPPAVAQANNGAWGTPCLGC
jgi:predicted N-acetyltransferase YhbS